MLTKMPRLEIETGVTLDDVTNKLECSSGYDDRAPFELWYQDGKKPEELFDLQEDYVRCIGEQAIALFDQGF